MGDIEEALQNFVEKRARAAAHSAIEELREPVQQLREDVRELRIKLGKLRKRVNSLSQQSRGARKLPVASREEIEKAHITPETVKNLREKHNLTQRQFARLIEVSPATVVSWEQGNTRPQPQNKAKLVPLLEMDESQVAATLQSMGAPPRITREDVKELRDKLDLTQKELASLLDVAPGTVANWEGGRGEPREKNRHAIAQLQRMPTEEVRRMLGNNSGNQEYPSGEQIKAIRREANMSQKDLAQELGVSGGTISNWERGSTHPQRRNADKIRQLARTHGIPLVN